MFAKLYTTPQGQALFTTVDGDDHYELHARYNIKSPIEGANCVVSKDACYELSDEGETARDEAFAKIDQDFADALSNERISIT